MEPELQQYADVYAELGVERVLPRWAIIGEDCRDEETIAAVGDMSGKVAIHLGDFYFPNVLRKNYGEPDESERLHDALCVQPDEYEDDSTYDIATPLLLTEAGDMIWGLECYWGALEEDGESLLQKFGIDIKQFTSCFGENRIFEKFRNFLRRAHEKSDSDD